MRSHLMASLFSINRGQVSAKGCRQAEGSGEGLVVSLQGTGGESQAGRRAVGVPPGACCAAVWLLPWWQGQGTQVECIWAEAVRRV